VRRWHPDVDHGDVGRAGFDETHQVLCRANLANDIQTQFGQKPCQALPHDDRVVRQDHAHGIAADTACLDPMGFRRRAGRRAPRPDPAVHAVRHPPRPHRRARRPHVHRKAAVDPCHIDGHARGLRVLDDIGQCLGRDEVRRRLHRGGKALRACVQLDRYRRASCQGAKRRTDSLLGEDRRVDAARECPQLLQRAYHLAVCLAQEFVDIGTAAHKLVARQLKREPDAKQSLLGSVVEVSFETAPLVVARIDQPGTRRAHSASCARSSACNREFSSASPTAAPTARDEVRIVEQRRIVHEGGHGPAVVIDHRHTPDFRSPGRRVDFLAHHEVLSLREPESQLERAVAEGVGNRLAHLRGSCRPSELDHQAGHDGSPPPHPQKAREEGDRDRGEHRVGKPQRQGAFGLRAGRVHRDDNASRTTPSNA
jgi:hypothetical protein